MHGKSPCVLYREIVFTIKVLPTYSKTCIHNQYCMLVFHHRIFCILCIFIHIRNLFLINNISTELYGYLNNEIVDNNLFINKLNLNTICLKIK